MLVLIGVTDQGQKDLLAMTMGYRESAEAWGAVLRGLKHRGRWPGVLGSPSRGSPRGPGTSAAGAIMPTFGLCRSREGCCALPEGTGRLNQEVGQMALMPMSA